jgi:hypothetical protein
MGKTEFTTKEEMDSFITGLFDTDYPEADPNWDLTVPSVDDIDGADVEFVTKKEVKDFISGLFSDN